MWSLLQMQTAHRGLAATPGLSFYKLLGTGQGAFSVWPDLDTYALLAVWDSDADRQRFEAQSPLLAERRERAEHEDRFLLEPLHCHGAWDGQQPFPEPTRKQSPHPVGVITRATIRARRLREFWEHVPQAAAAIQSAQGVRWFKGIGELPWIQQATFSVWEDMEAVRTFAYKHRVHAEIVKKTRQRQWYSEDLFARFAVLEHAQETLR